MVHLKTGLAAAAAAGAAIASGHAAADFYVGAAVGQTTVQVELSDYDYYYYFSDEERPKLDETDTAFKLFGGYMFNDYIGVEAAYLDMGQVSKTFGYDGGEFSLFSGDVTVDAELTGITVQLVGQYPIGPVDLFAKVGFLAYDVKLIETEREYYNGELEYIDRDRSSFEGTNTVWGVGVRYNFDRYAVRVEYEDFDVSELDDLNIISLGVEYRF